MMITSLQNEKVKLAHALQTAAKARRKERKIVLEGARLVLDACRGGHRPEFVLVGEGADAEALARLRALSIEPLAVSDEVLRHISDTQQPQGIVAVFPMPDGVLPADPAHVLILDAIRDPGNLGTILRTAAAAGVDAVLLSPTCADPYNPKALRGGMGAHFRVPLSGRTWAQIGEYCQHLTVYIADGDGELLYNAAEWAGRWGLIIGSEAHGAGDESRRLATARVRIPMAADSESLNAAVAAGVILFEARRER